MDEIDTDYSTYMRNFLGYLKHNRDGEIEDMLYKVRTIIARVEELQAEYEEHLRGN